MSTDTGKAPAVGDEVQISFVGKFRTWDEDDGRADVSTTAGWFTVPLSACTVVRKPLKVGDKITNTDPEPREETVLISKGGFAWQRAGALWYLGGHAAGNAWTEFESDTTFTVLHLPGETS